MLLLAALGRVGPLARSLAIRPAIVRPLTLQGSRLFSFAAPALIATEDCNPNRALYAALIGAGVAATCSPAAPKQCTPGAGASQEPPSTAETIAVPPADWETTVETDSVEGAIIAVDPGAVSQRRCSTDWEVRSHDALPPDWYTELPKGIKSLEMTFVRELTSAHPETVSTEGNKGHAKTHVCLYEPLNEGGEGTGQICNHLFLLPNNKGGKNLPQTSKVNTHNKVAHADMYEHPPFLASSSNGLERSLEKAKKQTTMMAAFGSSGAVGSSSSDAAPSQLSREDRQLAAQTQCLIYCKQVLSKQTLRDPYYVNMLQVQGTCRSRHTDGSFGQSGAVLTIGGFFDRTRAEFAVFQRYFSKVIDYQMEKAGGNAFGQILHDGGTLDNHIKHQAFGLQFVDPRWNQNFVICLGLTPLKDGTAPAVADLLRRELKDTYKYDPAKIIAASMQDGAAVAVAKELGVETEICLMHSADKVGASAIGDLVRSKNKIPINEFPEGQAVMDNVGKMATYFNKTETRMSELCKLAGAGDVIRLRTDKNGTRIAARWNLLYSALRDMIPIKQYAAGHEGEIEWCSTAEAWRDIMELEAVLVISKVLTTTAQFEKPFTGAWPNIAKAQVQSKLFAETIDVFDPLKAYHGEDLPRLARKVEELGEVGKEALRRAQLEFQRRYCGNETEIVDEDKTTVEHIETSDRELLASLLDMRTLNCVHLSKEQYQKACALLEETYVNFGLAHDSYEEEKRRAAAGDDSTCKACTEDEGAAAALVPVAVPAPASKKPKLLEQNPHDESSEEGEQFDAAEVREAALRDEFKRVFKCWKKFRAELYQDGAWRKYFTEPGAPDEIAARSSNPDNLRILLSNSYRPCSQENDKYDFDPQDDLIDQLHLDIGRIYRNLEHQSRFGFLPAMASCSTGQIGALMAESFCERILSCAKQVVHRHPLSYKLTRRRSTRLW